MKYPRRRKSASYLFCTIDGRYGKIVEFGSSNFTEANSITAKVIFFNCCSFLDFLWQENMSLADDVLLEIYNTVKRLDSNNQFLVITGSNDHEVTTISANILLSRCILINMKIKSKSVICLIPLLEIVQKNSSLRRERHLF